HHHVIGHVDNVVDAANADLFQGASKPVRARPDLDSLNNARHVARAQIGIIDADVNPSSRRITAALADGCGWRGHDRQSQRIASESADLAGNPDYTVEIRSIGCDF